VAKILVVEDELDLAERLRDWLTSEGHTFEGAVSGEDALQLLTHFAYDVVLLDWNLPGLTGLDVCKQYRQSGGQSSIIFLTGKSDIPSKEQGLDFGADDYLTKPFDLRELSARIRTVMRRPMGLLKDELKIGDVSLDVKSRTLYVNKEPIHLTPKESALLEFLMRHPNRTHGAKNLLQSVWASDREATTDTVRSWMRLLRHKLSGVGLNDFIKTVSGSGYMIQYDPDTTSEQ
jgi:OmpR-family two-component system manganese-sensing response regulator